MTDPGPPGDGKKGKRVFTRSWGNWHSVATAPEVRHGVGPKLGSVWGRNIAAHSDYIYSKSLQEHSTEVWNAENLEKYITNPDKFAPGTYMAVSKITDPQDKQNLIRYLFECHPDNNYDT